MSLNEGAETKKKDDGSVGESEIHSANSWETADLGDKSRNQKFLRLMGASKKQHHGRFVIGDQEGKHREKTDEKHMAEELEEQYKHSLEHSLVGGKKGHIGLGFHGEGDKPKGEEDDKPKRKEAAEPKEEKSAIDNDKEESNDTKPAEKIDSSAKEEVESNVKESKDRKRESFSLSEPEHEEAKKMKFVKSSSTS